MALGNPDRPSFLGVLAYSFSIRRSVRETVCLSLPFAILVALTFALGGHVYFENLFMSKWGQPFFAAQAFEMLVRTIGPNAFLCVFAALVWVAGRTRRDGQGAPPGGFDGPRRLLVWVAVLGCLVGAFLSGKMGANRNQYFVAYLALSALSIL